MSDGELLRWLADRVEALSDLALDALEVHAKATAERLDHLDGLAHRIDQQVAAIHEELDRYRPAIERFTDPGKAARAFLHPGRHEIRRAP